MADVVHLPVHPKPRAVPSRPGPAKEPPRALLQRIARDAYRRGVADARAQTKALDDLVTLMPGRWSRLVDRVEAWMGRDGHGDMVFAAWIALCVVMAIVSLAMGLTAVLL